MRVKFVIPVCALLSKSHEEVHHYRCTLPTKLRRFCRTLKLKLLEGNNLRSVYGHKIQHRLSARMHTCMHALTHTHKRNRNQHVLHCCFLTHTGMNTYIDRHTCKHRHTDCSLCLSPTLSLSLSLSLSLGRGGKAQILQSKHN